MTDQPKWTPGPWAVERNKRTWGWVDVVGPSLGVGGPTQATDLTLADEVKRIAEAHLIAAAPDLYAELVSLMAAYAECNGEDHPAYGRAEYALAKARGETK
jgi:hypothetical protein